MVVNSGKDGSRAFVTGDFTDTGLTSDVSGLTHSQWLDLLHWFEFYDKQYIYVGMFCESVHAGICFMSHVGIRDVNTRVLGYPGPVWPTQVPTRVP